LGSLAHENVPRVLYEYPVVEYIPLTVTTLHSGSLPAEVRQGRADVYPALHALTTAERWTAACTEFSFAFPDGETPSFLLAPPALRRDIAFLALGFRVAKGIYRGRKASLAVAEARPIFHLFTLPRVYFYRSRVDFVAFNRTGVQLAVAADVDTGPRYKREIPAPGRSSPEAGP